MGKHAFLIALLIFSLGFSTISTATLLSSDDFESETIGKEPSKWRYDVGDKRGEVIPASSMTKW